MNHGHWRAGNDASFGAWAVAAGRSLWRRVSRRAVICIEVVRQGLRWLGLGELDAGPGIWLTAQFCSHGSCVELQRWVGTARLRDTKQARLGAMQPTIDLVDDEYHEFASGVMLHVIDFQAGGIRVTSSSGELIELFHHKSNIKLQYTPEEWDSFRRGLIAGDFEMSKYEERLIS